MNLLVNTFNPSTESYTEHEYILPLGSDLSEAFAEARRHHPSWTSMVVTIVNPKGKDREV